ncbi:MAG: AraC family transcriptional regulator [Lachnospiraceae bacterium]|jgi:AraC-like DNA-binding protein|nr:AraC family transcriptional regulator [Lachnospiraceae bacterium]
MPALFEQSFDVEEFPVKAAEMIGTRSFLYHWHKEVEILVCLEGDVSAGIEGEAYHLVEGELLVIPERINHCLFPVESVSRRRVVKFSLGFFLGAEAFRESRESFARLPYHSREWSPEAAAEIAAAVKRISEEYQAAGSGWKEQVAAELYQIAAVILRKLPRIERQTTGRKKLPLTRVLEYLTEHYTEEISLKSCAAAVGFHEGYLSGLFKKQVGVSFHRYLQALRLQKALWLLVQTEQSIEAISEQSGFQSVKTFHRVFREEYGSSPGAWRKKNF